MRVNELKTREYVTSDERLLNVCEAFREYLAEEDEEDEEDDVWDKGLLRFMKTVGHSARRQ